MGDTSLVLLGAALNLGAAIAYALIVVFVLPSVGMDAEDRRWLQVLAGWSAVRLSFAAVIGLLSFVVIDPLRSSGSLIGVALLLYVFIDGFIAWLYVGSYVRRLLGESK